MMATIALPPHSVPFALARELLERQRMLALYGGAVLLLAIVALTLQIVDPRLLESGVNVWVKPARFLISVGVFALTAAWLFGYVRPDRRRSRSMRVTIGILILAGTAELAYIGWQGASGLESHFNTGTAFHAVMYALMGLFAVLLVGTTLPLAWEIGRRPAAGLRRDFVAALVVGLLLTFLLGGGLGGYMSAQPGHAVGPEGGHVALFGWNRSGGDLRIAHFLGIHAEQAVPVIAALASGLGGRTRWRLLIGGVAGYIALTVALFVQAVSGAPLWPL
jgi:hypothetical protein